MELRRHVHGKGKLSTLTCVSDDYGFGVSSVIVYGEENAMVIDTQFTLSNAHRVVAEIQEMHKNLETIFLTHAHPDHYFGTEVFVDAFPDVKVYALPEDIETINEQLFPKLDYWEGEIGKFNAPKKEFPIIPLTEDHLMLEGERVEITPKVWGDLKWNSKVWIPSIKTLYGSDILFNEAHPFTCEVSRKGLKGWIEELDKLYEHGAEVIIPGHPKPGMPFNESSMEFTKAYLYATLEELEKQKTVAGFYYTMVKRFPEAGLLRSNEMNANVYFGGREWHWTEDEDE